MSKLIYAGVSDVGFSRTVNEDFILIREFDDITFALVSDGAGSTGATFQPAAIAALEIYESVLRWHQEAPDSFKEQAKNILKESVTSAGRVLNAFKVANEELYNGFGSSVSCCLIFDDTLVFAHTGNTRINLIRKNKKSGEYQIQLLSKDQTIGQNLVDEGKITFEEYHLRNERLQLTGGLGISATPIVQTFELPLRANDFILLTTDGIHYALRPDVFLKLLQTSKTCQDGVDAMVYAAKSEEYADNMAAILLWNAEEKEER